ncbi:polysaccharide biosynthesis PFTS motif protein [Flavobacteriaceae bacterium]|nr:polysaccharide biosynthesis PFTS motif protein [Flavobacteriaceae bacterium]
MLDKQVIIKMGYDHLKDNDRLDYIYKLAKTLINQSQKIVKPVFDLPPQIINSTIKQFYIQRILHLKFNKSILIALANKKQLKIGLPLPWLSWLEENEGFTCNTFSNRIRWKLEVFYWYFVGIYFFLRYLLILFKLFNEKHTPTPFVYFDNLSELNFPKEFTNSKTIVNWYFKNEDFAQIKELLHNEKKIKDFEEKGVWIKSSELPFRLRVGKNLLFSYFVALIRISISAFFQILKGNPIPALLLKEYPLLFLSRKARKVDFAKNYFFHNSTAIYKPLWVHEAEKKGAIAILYFYSANNRLVSIKEKDHQLFGHKEFMSWNKYYVWNTYQERYIKSLLPDVKTKIVGPIWFQSSNAFMKNLKQSDKKIISVFDVQPYKMERYRILGMPNEYYTLSTISTFHQDIVDLFSGTDEYLIVLKRKRNTNMLDKGYLVMIEKLYTDLPFIQLNPEIDAHSLIEVSFASIHLPSTSTALIAEDLGIKSIYYDGTLSLNKDDQSLAGIELIQGKDQLEEWKKSLI